MALGHEPSQRKKRGNYVTMNFSVARRYSCESEFRLVSGPFPVARAAWLVIYNICSLRVAALAVSSLKTKIGHKKVEKAVMALRAGRPIGKLGRPRHIQPLVEAQLIKWIDAKRKGGEAPSIREISDKATMLALQHVPNPSLAPLVEPVSVYKFFERNLTVLKKETPRSIEMERLIPTETVQTWFEKNGDIIKSKDHRLIFNWDETMGTISENKKTKVITMRDSPHSHRVGVVTRNEHTTIGLFICADGTRMGHYQTILPLVELPFFDNADILEKFDVYGQSKGCGCALLLKQHPIFRWVSTKIMEDVIKKVFIPGVAAKRSKLGLPPNAPALLLWDGHVTHETPEICALLEQYSITPLLFVPHASHLMQPLDLGVFRSFKSALKEKVSDAIREHVGWDSGAAEKRELYLEQAGEAMDRGTEKSTVRKSFKRAGIFPFDPQVVLNAPALTETQALVQKKIELKRKRTGINITDGNGYRGGPDIAAASAAAKAAKKASKKAATKAAKVAKTNNCSAPSQVPEESEEESEEEEAVIYDEDSEEEPQCMESQCEEKPADHQDNAPAGSASRFFENPDQTLTPGSRIRKPPSKLSL